MVHSTCRVQWVIHAYQLMAMYFILLLYSMYSIFALHFQMLGLTDVVLLLSDNLVTKSVVLNVFQVPAEECRSAVGSVLAEDGAKPNPNDVKQYESHGFKLFSFPATSHSVVTSFPYVTGVSVWLATMRVYAAMSAYIKVKSFSDLQGKQNPL